MDGESRISEGLLSRARSIEEAEAAGVHGRHEELIDRAVERDGLSRELAEQVYALSEEESVPPAYGLALVASRIGVVEYTEPETHDDDSLQAAPPDWVSSRTTDPAAIARERHLRAGLRRLRAHLERADSAQRAFEGLLSEPDIGRVAY